MLSSYLMSFVWTNSNSFKTMPKRNVNERNLIKVFCKVITTLIKTKRARITATTKKHDKLSDVELVVLWERLWSRCKRAHEGWWRSHFTDSTESLLGSPSFSWLPQTAPVSSGAWFTLILFFTGTGQYYTVVGLVVEWWSMRVAYLNEFQANYTSLSFPSWHSNPIPSPKVYFVISCHLLYMYLFVWLVGFSYKSCDTWHFGFG